MSPAPGRALSANRGPGALPRRPPALRCDTLARLTQSTQPTDRRVGSAATKVLEARRPGKAACCPWRTAHKAHDPHSVRGGLHTARSLASSPAPFFSRFELPLGARSSQKASVDRNSSTQVTKSLVGAHPDSILAQGPGNERQLAEVTSLFAENCARARMSRVKLINNSEFLTSNRPTNSPHL